MLHSTILEILLVIWGVITVGLVCLMIRRSVLSMKEEDQLFLDKAEEHMAVRQREVIAQILQVGKWITIVAIVDGVLLLVIAGVWVYIGLTSS